MTTVGTGTEFGQPYVEVRWQGTAGSTTFLTLGHGPRGAFNPALQAPVTPGLNYTASVGYRLLAGTLPTTNSQVGALFFSASGAFISGPSSAIPAATAALQRVAAIGPAPAGAAYCQPIWRVFVSSGAVVDFTMRFYTANVEQGIGNARPLLQRNVPEVVADIGDLDAEALLSHCGAGDGFVPTRYDQSGNGRHATQTDPTRQPQIVSNGVMNMINGRPAVRFNGTSTFLNAPGVVMTGQNWTFSGTATMASATQSSARLVSAVRSVASGGTGNDWGDTASWVMLARAQATSAIWSEGVVGVMSIAFDTPYVISITRNSGASIGVIDGVTRATSSGSLSGLNTTSGLRIGRSINPPNFELTEHWAGLGGDIFLLQNLSTTDRQLLERSQGAYYGITVA
jgi:hypothetical protein